MAGFKSTGKLQVERRELEVARKDFSSGRASEQAIMETVKDWDKQHGYTLDPHTACGVSAVNQLRETLGWAELVKHEMVVLGTAHPAKFSDAVCQAMGRPPTMPPALGRVQGARTRFEVLPNSMQAVRENVEAVVRNREAGTVSRPCAVCFTGVRRLLFGKARL